MSRAPRFAAGSPEVVLPPNWRKELVDLPLPLLDLTGIARPGGHTTISVGDWRGVQPWIKLNDVSLTKSDRGTRTGTWMLDAFWRDHVTDSEHDSAHILRLDLGGVELDMVYYGRVSITAWITGAVDDFCVPPLGYAEMLMAHPQTTLCKECRKRDKSLPHHMVVPSGFYVPPKQPELYAQMIGRRVAIEIDRFTTDEE